MAPKIYGLIGRSLKHSWSKFIHEQLTGCDYRIIELEPHELPAFFSRADIGGINVTIPYKRDAMRFCDEISPEARAVGSVNTVVRGEDGLLRGYNTDLTGFIHMAKRAGIPLLNRKAVILGSGGASLAARSAAKALGAREIVTISRSGPDNYENLHKHADAKILINATPVGMYPANGACPVELASFPACEGVLDLIYNPMRTALVMRARARGMAACGGLAMLAAQAKAAAELFFGRPIADGEIERVLLELRLKMENIVLIGMPGCGKSTIGAILAGIAGRPAVDLDDEIVKAAGKGIIEIFREDGEEAFRALERQVAAAAGAGNGQIIMTGGGVVKDRGNYEPLRQNGRIYFIDRSPDALARAGRPLSLNADLREMHRERLSMYRAFCDATVDGNAAPQDIAETIWRDFCEDSRD